MKRDERIIDVLGGGCIDSVLYNGDVVEVSGGDDGVYLCKCNKCGDVLIDNNHQVNATIYEYRKGMKETIYLNNDNTGDFFFGCPNCLTDGYLRDL